MYFSARGGYSPSGQASVILCLFLGGTTATVAYGQKTWTAPANTNSYKNPYEGNPDATAAGKKLYQQFCAICHGNKGKGDGLAGMTLKPRPSNFTSKPVQSQADGAIYWKITEGNAPMASYKATLTEQQRWQLVNYIRQLGRIMTQRISRTFLTKKQQS